MNTSTFEKFVRPTYPSATPLSYGDACAIGNDGKLSKAASTSAVGIFFALDNAAANENVAVLVAGASPSTVLANAVAGAYKQGQFVYLAADGKVAGTGTVKIGVYLDAGVTLEGTGGKLHVAPLTPIAI